MRTTIVVVLLYLHSTCYCLLSVSVLAPAILNFTLPFCFVCNVLN